MVTHPGMAVAELSSAEPAFPTAASFHLIMCGSTGSLAQHPGFSSDSELGVHGSPLYPGLPSD